MMGFPLKNGVESQLRTAPKPASLNASLISSSDQQTSSTRSVCFLQTLPVLMNQMQSDQAQSCAALLPFFMTRTIPGFSTHHAPFQ
jgi:hypothetical protein